MLLKVHLEELALQIRYEEARTEAEKARAEVEVARTQGDIVRTESQPKDENTPIFQRIGDPLSQALRKRGPKRKENFSLSNEKKRERNIPSQSTKRTVSPKAVRTPKVVQRSVSPVTEDAEHPIQVIAKRGRGRPRKNPLGSPSPLNTDSVPDV